MKIALGKGEFHDSVNFFDPISVARAWQLASSEARITGPAVPVSQSKSLNKAHKFEYGREESGVRGIYPVIGDPVGGVNEGDPGFPARPWPAACPCPPF